MEHGQDDKSTPVGNQHLATDAQTKNEDWRRFGGIQEEVLTRNARRWRKNAEKFWKTTAWVTYDGDVPVVKRTSSNSEMAGYDLVE